MFVEMRAKLLTDLQNAGISVYEDRWSDRTGPPAVMVRHPLSTSYIAGGQLVGEFELNLDLLLVVRAGDEASSELDDLIELVLINSADWAFRGVDTIALFNIHGVDYPGTVVHIAKAQRLY